MLTHREQIHKIIKIYNIKFLFIIPFLTALLLATQLLTNNVNDSKNLQFEKFNNSIEFNFYLNSHFPKGSNFSDLKKILLDSQAFIYYDSLIKQKNVVLHQLRSTFFKYQIRKFTSIFPCTYIVKVVHNTLTDEIINLSGEALSGP